MPQPRSNSSTSISQKYREEIEGYYGLMITIVLIAILLYSILLTSQKTIILGATILATSTTTILAWTMIGGFLGFLFGIPKLLQRTGNQLPQPLGNESQPIANINKFLNSNSNLEEISDWVTKIIVGLGLTQITSLPTYIYNYGQQFASIDINEASIPLYFILLTLFAVFSGFLLAYIETRTRITSLLLSTESELTNGPSGAQLREAAEAKQFLEDEKMPREATGRFQRTLRASPTSVDAEILKAPLTSFTDAEALAARASAHARAGELLAAENTWIRALAYYPSSIKPEYYIRLAEVQAQQNKIRDAVSTLLEAQNIWGYSLELLKKILFLSLYIPPPLGFQTAIDAGNTAARLPDADQDPMIFVWRAAAYGQLATWNKDKVENQEKFAEARKVVIDLARRLNKLVPDRSERPRVLMREMLDPVGQEGPLGDSDLSIFKDDEEVRSIIME